MKTQKDIPYGTSDFRSLIQQKMYYVDKTRFIEEMEGGRYSFLFFLRPSGFGKSLLLSTLNYYYGIQYKDEFDSLFGGLYAGKNPTDTRNSYYVMNFDFSELNASALENIMADFNDAVLKGLIAFNNQYKFLDQEEFGKICKNTYPSFTLADYTTYIQHKLKHNIMILIDEYDSFTNDTLSYHFTSLADIVSKNAFVRTFYEVIKHLTGQGTVSKFLGTGVLPISLDSMSSGFNIATDISGEAKFNEMAGFTAAEVKQMVYDFFPGITDSAADTIMKDAADWYNGSLFSARAKTKIYNPAMLLRFISKINPGTLAYPRDIVDTNVESDFSKINNFIGIQDRDQNLEAVKTILKTGTYNTQLTRIYSFERNFTVEDFISLLYYNGLLTIKEPLDFVLSFEIPNYVIKEVYWRFFCESVEENREDNG